MPKYFTSHDEVLRTRWFLFTACSVYARQSLQVSSSHFTLFVMSQIVACGPPTAITIKTTYSFRLGQDIKTCQPPCWPAANSPLTFPIKSRANTRLRLLSGAHTSLTGPSLAPCDPHRSSKHHFPSCSTYLFPCTSSPLHTSSLLLWLSFSRLLFPCIHQLRSERS